MHVLVVCTSSEIKECGMIVKIVLIFIVFMYYFTCISFAIQPSAHKSAINPFKGKATYMSPEANGYTDIYVIPSPRVQRHICHYKLRYVTMPGIFYLLNNYSMQ